MIHFFQKVSNLKILFSCLLIFSFDVDGKNIYVSKQGRDSNNGLTLTEPFKTIQEAVKSAYPGDNILIRKGIYQGFLIEKNPGTEKEWIKIKPYQNEKVVIDGSGKNETIYFYNDDFTPMYWIIEGLEITKGDIYAIKIDTPKVIIVNNVVHDSKKDLIKLVHTANDVAILNNELFFSYPSSKQIRNAQAIDIVGADRVLVRGNYVHNIPSIGIYSKGNARNSIFELNFVTNTLGASIQLGQSTDAHRLYDGNYETYDGIIRNNLITNSSEACLAVSSSRTAKVEYNTCFNSAINKHGSIYISNESEIKQTNKDVSIQNNFIITSSKSNKAAIKIASHSFDKPISINIDNNFYWKTNNQSKVTYLWEDDGLYDVSFNKWKKETEQDLHSAIVNPFEKIVGDDYSRLRIDLSWTSTKLEVNSNKHSGAKWLIKSKENENFSKIVNILKTRKIDNHINTSLFRRPYIQSPNQNTILIKWATFDDVKGMVQLKYHDSEISKNSSNSIYFPISKTKQVNDYYLHEVSLTNLKKNINYQYQIYSENIPMTEQLTLKTLPDSDENVSFIVVGDMGSQYSQVRKNRNRISLRKNNRLVYPHDFIVSLGDNAYNSGNYRDYELKFFGQLSGKNDNKIKSSILDRVPFFAALGNHDYANNINNTPSAYLDAFSLPEAKSIPKKDLERYYSFDAGKAHFIVLDTMKFTGNAETETQLRLSQMLAWLKNDLSKTKQKWKIVFFHHAVFSNGAHGTWGDIKENRSMREKLIPILQMYHVKLVFFGHDHFYQRSKPISVDTEIGKLGRLLRDSNNNLVESGGIIYVLSGFSGGDLGSARPPSIVNSKNWKEEVNKFGIGYDFVATKKNNGQSIIIDKNGYLLHGFIHVVITDKIVVNATQNDGKIIDSFIIN